MLNSNPNITLTQTPTPTLALNLTSGSPADRISKLRRRGGLPPPPTPALGFFLLWEVRGGCRGGTRPQKGSRTPTSPQTPPLLQTCSQGGGVQWGGARGGGRGNDQMGLDRIIYPPRGNRPRGKLAFIAFSVKFHKRESPFRGQNTPLWPPRNWPEAQTIHLVRDQGPPPCGQGEYAIGNNAKRILTHQPVSSRPPQGPPAPSLPFPPHLAP